MIFKLLLLNLVLLSGNILISPPLYAQEDTSKPIEETISEADSNDAKFERIKLTQLKRTRTELVTLRHNIQKNEERLKQNPDLVTKIKLENELVELKKKYNDQSFLFIELATNISLREQVKNDAKTSFTDDIKEILSPVIQSVKDVSVRPRLIQDLNSEIAYLTQRAEDAQSALKNLENFYTENKHKELKWTIKRSIGQVKEILEETKIQLEDKRFKKLKIEQNQESIVTTFSVLIFNFFKTKGKNLFLAFFVFIALYWPLSYGRSRIVSLILFRIHQSKSPEHYLWVIRPIKVIYSALTFLAALFFAILTLYVLNDWVLVTIILFVIVAVIWSSKQYLPAFFEQSKIVLNLGSVREGERVIYNDLPWKVKSLGFYCRFENPSLSGGTLRISSRELVNLNSRPINKTESWFPTKIGDWVEYQGLFGKITMQSPEQVVLKRVTSEHVYIKTTDFYNGGPINLSQGFAVCFNFGLDYNLQKKMFDEVIPNIRKEIKDSFDDMLSQSKEFFKEFSVDFAYANASSLDLRIFLKCDGSLAPKKRWLERNLQEVIVKACNKYDYSIPFNQLTVHTVNG